MMKHALVVLALFVSISANSAENIKVFFSPRGGCAEAVVHELRKAQSTVFVAAYGFTNTEIAKALLAARSKNVKVQIILDDSNQTEKYSAATFLQNAGIQPLVDSKHAIFHNKFMVIDGATLITGSFNFTKAAEEHNAENMLVIQDSKLCGKYLTNWLDHSKHCSLYTKKGAENGPNNRATKHR